MPDIDKRIAELAEMADGWLGGACDIPLVGIAPTPERLEAARRAAHTIVLHGGVAPPHIYPTEDGWLRFEWAGVSVEMSGAVDVPLFKLVTQHRHAQTASAAVVGAWVHQASCTSCLTK